MTPIDEIRLALSKSTSSELKAELGQYMTPCSTADFMASLFSPAKLDPCHLLDPGAGIGTLSIAFLNKLPRPSGKVQATVCEIDSRMRGELARTLTRFIQTGTDIQIDGNDFIETAVNWLQFAPGMRFTHVIMNPPYKKISSDSVHRRLLRQVDIETVNLYSAFVALGLKLLVTGGELVAIVPRSFCNGPYYRPFRKMLLDLSAIRHIHLFNSRNKAFKDDNVLQENIIVKLEKDAKQDDVVVSTSTDDTLGDYHERRHAFCEIVQPDDAHRFIHIPTCDEQSRLSGIKVIRHTLTDIGVTVSTGPIVDFRVKQDLRMEPTPETVPLLYPAHIGLDGNCWPKRNSKKPNALIGNAVTSRFLFPAGFYCVVKRFSAKEERKRITASVVGPDLISPHRTLGFENHLNVFHSGKAGIPKFLAYGLAAYLNATVVDQYFRCFNGHTQVNATDLRQMRYPSREFLIQLGEWASTQASFSQHEIDRRIGALE
jgi:tRNA1(Val) A37 N6-methylase TrmN6